MNEPCPLCGELVKVRAASTASSEDWMHCAACDALFVRYANRLVDIGHLKVLHPGEEPVYRALNDAKVASVRSLLDLFDQGVHEVHLTLGMLQSSLRATMIQIENRLENALSDLGEFAFVSDKARQGLDQLREAQELVSSLSRRHRGMTERPRPPKGG